MKLMTTKKFFMLAAMLLLACAPMGVMAQDIQRLLTLDEPEYDMDVFCEGYVKREGGWTNARMQPSTSSKIATKIKDGTEVIIVRGKGNWSEVFDTNQYFLGYVHNSKLVVTAYELNPGYIKREGGYTNIRTKASGDAPIAEKIKDGTTIMFRATNNNWYKVYTYDTWNFLGYVHKSKIVQSY